jgi:hypothetical protein
MTMKPILPMTFALAVLAGCATTPRTPEWVHGAASQYPAEQYLVGRGQAPNVEQAQERARADLAKVFEVAVAVESQDVQAYKSQGGGQYEATASRRIVTRTDQIVRGIRIAELWQDPATRNHHALAVLPRLQAATSLREEVAKRDEAIARHVAQARSEADPLARIGAANRALDLALERDGFQKSLKVVDITGRGVESEYAAARLRADLDELVKRVRIAPRVSGDADADALARGALAAAGFLAETGENPQYVLDARLKLDDLGLKDGWYWNRGAVEVTLIEAANGRVRGTKSWNVKGSAPDRATARTRALAEADAALKKDLRATLTGFAAGQ